MARNKSEWLKGWGKAHEVFKTIVDGVLALGGTDEDIGRILTSSKLRDKIAKCIVDGRKAVESGFHLVVDYALPIEEMVKAGGYSLANSNITHGHFPHDKGRGKIEVLLELVHLDRSVGSGDEAVRELGKLGYRPADLPEGLAFAAAHPEEQRRYPIAILGSVWPDPYGLRYVAYLGGDAGHRNLHLLWLERGWDELWRFAAVRK